MLKEIDYLTSAVKNISKNAKYLGIDVTKEMLLEKLALMTSDRFSIVFSKKPVEKHRNIPRLKFDLPLKKNRRQREVTKNNKSFESTNTRSLLPLGIGLLLVGFLILLQIILGIFTLIYGAQIKFASMHQVSSIFLVSSSIYFLFINKTSNQQLSS